MLESRGRVQPICRSKPDLQIKADRLESLFFDGYDPYFEGDELRACRAVAHRNLNGAAASRFTPDSFQGYVHDADFVTLMKQIGYN